MLRLSSVKISAKQNSNSKAKAFAFVARSFNTSTEKKVMGINHLNSDHVLKKKNQNQNPNLICFCFFFGHFLPNSQNVGFIGLGNMGSRMAPHLMLKGGHKLFVYDINDHSVNQAASKGAIPCSSPKEVVKQAGMQRNKLMGNGPNSLETFKKKIKRCDRYNASGFRAREGRLSWKRRNFKAF